MRERICDVHVVSESRCWWLHGGMHICVTWLMGEHCKRWETVHPRSQNTLNALAAAVADAGVLPALLAPGISQGRFSCAPFLCSVLKIEF